LQQRLERPRLRPGETCAHATRGGPSPSPSGDPIADLPVDGTVGLPGLPGSVDVVTDDHGVKHIYGATSDAVLFVQGYVTASQRFFSMDVLRKFATGRLSELFSSLHALDGTSRTGPSFTTRDGRRIQTALRERLEAEYPEGARSRRSLRSGKSTRGSPTSGPAGTARRFRRNTASRSSRSGPTTSPSGPSRTRSRSVACRR
jgi:hypothetical protein